MTTSIQTQQTRQTWDLKKVQETAAKLVAHKIVSRLHCIDKNSGKEIDEMEKASAHLKAGMLKQVGVKTPIDLVKHLAEFEANMFASEVSTQGDEHNAVLLNEKSTVWLEVKKLGNINKDQEAKMQKHYRQWMEDLAQEFGFKVQVDITNDGNSSKITFSSK